MKYAYEVPPLSRMEIMGKAAALRSALRISEHSFPILHVVEIVMGSAFEDFSFEIKTKEEMGDNLGLTHPALGEILIREDVYEGARKGSGPDRFTIAHELAHYLLHREPGLARMVSPSRVIPYHRNSEWQANAFAGSLLVPIDAVKQWEDPRLVARACDVSVEAAAWEIRALHNLGLLT